MRALHRYLRRPALCLALMALLLPGLARAQATLRAGAGEADITPAASNADWRPGQSRVVYLAGFGENRPAAGIHDHIWARAVVLEARAADVTNLSGCQLASADLALRVAHPHPAMPFRLALVSLDLIGYYWNQGTYGAQFAREAIAPGLRPDLLLVSSTHDHEAPDTIGLWGPRAGADGKDPEYLKFVDRQIARAVERAMGSLASARMLAGTIDAGTLPELRQLQQRTRPPNFTDDQLRVIQLLRQRPMAGEARVIATLVNWNTHPESMESRNRLLTSDFVGPLRQSVERRTGGECIYFSGDLGAVEAPGDDDVPGRSDELIHGNRFPRDPRTHAAIPSFKRTRAIGEAVADAAMQAVRRVRPVTADRFRIRTMAICPAITNTGYLALQQTGVLNPKIVATNPPRIGTTLYDVRYGDVEFLSLPGELFPELYYGAERHHRTDCPAANTGRPYEPAIADWVKARVPFLLGLTPDELGYILPNYDFRPLPPAPMIPGKRAVDACAQTPDHYHETNSVGYEMGPAVTCGYVTLLGGRAAQFPACQQATESAGAGEP